ncbi:MAG: AbrB/MazE/SpoVT family DNA-binding domain-containing protein [Clostridia bacterium]|nr:AbrB/MazE/SpoVT family DNA-binding domain-containing protein [Clostridia bacterium]
MIVKVQKWGNSLALRIPKSFAEEIKLKVDSRVNLSLQENKLVIESVDETPEYELKELLLKVQESNIHTEYSFGKPEGKEIW